MSDKKTSYKLLSLDLDGTLLSPILRHAKKADCIAIQDYMSVGGIPFINTGRAPWAIVKTIRRINNEGPNRIRLMSCWNGAYIHDFNDGEIIQKQISHEYCKKIFEIVKKHRGMIWFYTSLSLQKQTIYVHPLNPIIKMGYPLATLQSVKKISDLTSFKIDILSVNKTKIAKIYHELIKNNFAKAVTISHSSPRLIEITPLNVNKGYAVNYFAKKYNIQKTEIVSMGDSFNDLSAFKNSVLSIGINPKNPKLLEHCTAIVDHKSKGVREGIDSFILSDVDKQKFKLIFTDLDGTLLDNKTKLFSNETKLALQQCSNHLMPIAIATGRGIHDTLGIINALELNPKATLYIIGNNGATIYDVSTHKYIYQAPIHKDDARRVFKMLIDFAKENKGNLGFIVHPHTSELLFFNEKFWKPFNLKKTGREDQYDPWANKKPIYINKFPKNIICYKFVVKFPNHEQALIGLKQLRKTFKDLEVCLSSDVNLEINKKGVNKGVAAIKLSNKIKIDMQHTLVLGDGQNDIPALKLSKNSFVPSYAPEYVKKEARYVVPDVNVTNFASTVINQFVLKRSGNNNE
ncbi:MAG: HAD-IIB family hydrolase [Mycoplasma sp.]|nr:HAD-IIB family hydrolase [Candidatus Hennigella equi]